MTAGVTPISVEERKSRVKRARKVMADEGFDALVVAGGTSLDHGRSVGDERTEQRSRCRAQGR